MLYLKSARVHETCVSSLISVSLSFLSSEMMNLFQKDGELECNSACKEHRVYYALCVK